MDRLRGAAKTKLDEGIVFWLTMRRIGAHDNDVSQSFMGSFTSQCARAAVVHLATARVKGKWGLNLEMR